MTREIKFRGRHIVTGEWQYGYLLSANCIGIVKEVYTEGRGYRPQITEFCIVDRESVGQFTGLKDKNGKDIYEGDILRTNDAQFSVFYSYGGYRLIWKEDVSLQLPVMDMPTKYYEVIGDIHTTPNLLNNADK